MEYSGITALLDITYVVNKYIINRYRLRETVRTHYTQSDVFEIPFFNFLRTFIRCRYSPYLDMTETNKSFFCYCTAIMRILSNYTQFEKIILENDNHKLRRKLYYVRLGRCFTDTSVGCPTLSRRLYKNT